MPIKDYKLKGGATRYRVIYRRPDGKQTSKRGFRFKREAAEFEASVTVAKAAGTFVSATDGKATVATLGTDWLAAHEATVKPSTYHSDESAWRIHVKPKWGARAVASIRHTEVTAWVAELAKTKSPTTVARCHGVLAAILDAAQKDRRIVTNPARDVKLPRKPKARNTYLTHQQVTRLAAETKHPEFILFLAYSGLRWGEAAGLRVMDVDLTTRRANIEQNAVQVGGRFVVGTPKDDDPRTVVYPKFMDAAMKAACAGKKPDALVWGDGTHHLRQGNAQSGWFAGAVKRVIKGDPTFPRVTPHDLRHTAASLAISAGANVKAVQNMLGHSSAAMTLDRYTDLFPDDLDGVAKALDKARRKAVKRQQNGNGSATSNPKEA